MERRIFSQDKNLLFVGLILTALLSITNAQSSIQNCEQMKNGMCVSCLKGFALSSNRQSCVTSPISNCVYLDIQNNCIECTCGMVVNPEGTQCINVSIEGCRKVDTSGKCIEAKPFYMLTPQGVFFNMNNNCKVKSNIWNTFDCSQCHEGYYLQNGRCMELSTIASYSNTYAANFMIDATNNLVFTCLGGYQNIQQNSQNGCYLTISNCITYVYNGGLASCWTCDVGYISSNNGTVCTIDNNQIQNCAQIDNPASYQCVRCNSESLILSGPNLCTSRVQVTGCANHDPKQNTCLQCDSSHFLQSSTTCTSRANNANCSIVDPQADKCIACSNYTLYYLDSSTKTCKTRVNIGDANCIQYDPNSDSCTLCKQAYYLFSGTCTARTTTNCINGVPDKNKCSLCNADYILLPDGTCKQDTIGKKCLAIDSSGVCTQCIDGYGIAQQGETCYDNFQNIPMCSVYVKSSQTTCQQCQTGFLLSTDSQQCLISYGSCKQQAPTCNQSYQSTPSSYEKYTCDFAAIIQNQTISSIIIQFQFILYAIVIIMCLQV
ncbi:hypothetical protein TTHERM_00305641 (macronuclear) [Tetrahymena thermophila SB210]|uniref:Transmembrane protein n=1 Tax=Tetrahymena thermophila (strain SB210) TaxID=312017 RepID=A4VD94_TETTS|nr:hypothetical protein TTHERM_00305641 [Tetrahymena thermophila SB210]EDK31499.1 hypothetical protein TTHERM_00305641 [Tetrahymena thermophila SB210]|eukprot:XP_001470927.1 hypothetical protein TTHERM_00305641 [Tetrahymena thermophila SB210]